MGVSIGSLRKFVVRRDEGAAADPYVLRVPHIDDTSVLDLKPVPQDHPLVSLLEARLLDLLQRKY